MCEKLFSDGCSFGLGSTDCNPDFALKAFPSKDSLFIIALGFPNLSWLGFVLRMKLLYGRMKPLGLYCWLVSLG
jgi:hypothetical protein